MPPRVSARVSEVRLRVSGPVSARPPRVSGPASAMPRISMPDVAADLALLIRSRFSLSTSEFIAPTTPNAATGSNFVADNDLTLECGSMPAGSFAFFLTSQLQGFTSNPGGSQGNLCLGGTIARFRAQVMGSGSDGRIEVPIDLTAIPITPPTAILPGETWRFQAWYRGVAGGAPTSNFCRLLQKPACAVPPRTSAWAGSWAPP